MTPPPPLPLVTPPLVASAAPSPAVSVPALPYPEARRVDQVDDLHGVKVADPVPLAGGRQERRGEEVGRRRGRARAVLPRQAPAARRHRRALQGAPLHRERGNASHVGQSPLLSRVATPARRRRSVYWREGRSGPEKVLLDPNEWSTDGSASLGVWSPSWDGKRVAYTVKANNSDESTLYVMDVATGKKSDVDVIEGTRYASPSWTASGDGFYYTWIPPKDSVPTADRPGFQEVRFHQLGADPEKDPRRPRANRATRRRSSRPACRRNGRWLLLTTQHGWTRYDVHFMDLQAAKPTWQPLAVGQDAVYEVDVDGDHFFVKTNEGAPKYRVFKVDAAAPGAATLEGSRRRAQRRDARVVRHRRPSPGPRLPEGRGEPGRAPRRGRQAGTRSGDADPRRR